MKTAEYILIDMWKNRTSHFRDFCIDDFFTEYAKQIALDAMQLYAAQAIERCAEVAEIRYGNGSCSKYCTEVNEQSILNVKKELR